MPFSIPMRRARSLILSGMPALTKIAQKITVPSTKMSAMIVLKTRVTLRTVHGSILRITRRTLNGHRRRG